MRRLNGRAACTRETKPPHGAGPGQIGIVEAMIRRLTGFDLHETVILPENGEKLIGFAAHPSVLAVAMLCLVPAAEYYEACAVTDPETGLTFGYLRYTETQSNRVFVTVE